jgi:hypothetical protein
MSDLSWARPHRAAVASARQNTENPMLKNADGCDIPCQPRRNSSINFITRTICLPAAPKCGGRQKNRIRGLRSAAYLKFLRRKRRTLFRNFK